MEAELGDAGRVSAEAPANAGGRRADPDADRVISVDLDAFSPR
jgi:hypothetical protein